MGKDQSSGNIERATDVAAAASVFVDPTGLTAVALTAVNKVGHAIVDLMAARGRDSEVAIIEQAVTEAAVAINGGNADVADAVIQQLATNDLFQRAVKKAAREMLDQPPCVEAVRPIGMLMAQYSTMRVDAEFRNWLGFLCDVKAVELQALRQLLARHVELGIPEFNAQIHSATDPRTVVLRAHYGVHGKAEHCRFELGGAVELCSTLAGHDLALAHQVTGQLPGTGTLIYDTTPETLTFAAKLLGR